MSVYSLTSSPLVCPLSQRLFNFVVCFESEPQKFTFLLKDLLVSSCCYDSCSNFCAPFIFRKSERWVGIYWKSFSFRVRIWSYSRSPFSLYHSLLPSGDYLFNLWCRALTDVSPSIVVQRIWSCICSPSFSCSSNYASRDFTWEKWRENSVNKLLVVSMVSLREISPAW